MKIVIVGGVAGGATAAARLRRIDENSEIIMVERGDYISFANCGLPYHIGGTIKDRDNLLVQTPEGFKARFNVDIRIKTEAVKIEKKEKKIILKNLKTGEEYAESYDYLILSPGAEPIKPPLPGIESKRIYTLRNMNDMDKIIDSINNIKPKRALVIGGGFIGIEVAENLLDRNINVTLVEMADQILGPIDYEMAAMIHSHMKDKNIELYLKDGVSSFEDKEGYTLVNLKSGKRIKTDMIIMAIGVKPENKLAVEAGLAIGERGGISVDEYLKTDDDNIYAVGDAIEVTHLVGKNKVQIPLAWPANRQGRIVADTIYGNKTAYKGSLGTSILKAFDLTAAATGLNEKILRRMKIEYKVCITHSSSHASYYPGASPIAIKLIFTKEGEILGAQAVGIDGVDKRIDVIATAIIGKLKVWDLQELELAYAPPFGSAKDPVNMAGYVAHNMIKEDLKTLNWDEVDGLDLNDKILLDVRTKEENDLGTIKDAVNIPLDELRENLDKLDKNKEIIVFCQVGLRGYVGYRILVQNGFKVRNLSGGYKTYSYAVDKQENPDIFDYEQIKPIHGEIQEEIDLSKTIKLDACGLQCPGPIMQTFKTMQGLETGQILEIKASDFGFKKDIKAWADKTGNTLLNVDIKDGQVNAMVKKGGGVETKVAKESGNGQTIVVFNGELDKAIASFIIANGALAMGKKVSMFFTFWGLNVLRKEDGKANNKNFIESMFGMMMPKGTSKLGLSRMNFGGLGAMMIKGIMKNKNVDSLEKLMATYLDNGGKIIACTMSMDLMGIKEEELIDGIDYGGVATYLGDAEESNGNLFI